MTHLTTLCLWENLITQYQQTDAVRAHYEQVAWDDIDRRTKAEQKVATYTETLFSLTQQIAETEAKLPVALHQAAEIVNAYALVVGWREW